MRPRQRGRICSRQLEVERRATPIVAEIPDRAAVRIDDAVTDRQAKAGALADRLRREERLKQLRFIRRRHAMPIVLHLEADVFTCFEKPYHYFYFLAASVRVH